MKQSEIIKLLSDGELKKQLFLSQGLFIALSLFLSLFLFDSFFDWFHYFEVHIEEIIKYGLFPGLIIVLLILGFTYILPKRYYDDGGINQRIFGNRSIAFIAALSLTVATAEEFLFRGVAQTTFGYLFASILFAVAHIRYLKKPFLFIYVLVLSFYIGYLFEVTGNLLVTITIHFTIDFLLGIFIS